MAALVQKPVVNFSWKLNKDNHHKKARGKFEPRNQQAGAGCDETMRTLSRTFRSVKRHLPRIPKSSTQSSPSSSSLSRKSQANPSPRSKSSSWSVYLILSTNAPIKTYVGVTNNFSRRLKQHNGEHKGGAKATRAGRPWICACLIQGFNDRSEACEFESKWKSISRKLPRKRKAEDMSKQVDNGSHALLQHRQAALNKVKGSSNCIHLEIDWKLDSS